MVEQIVDRWAQALGGRERLGQVEAVYLRLKIEMGGLTGTLEEWCTAHGQHRQRFDLGGVYKTVIVFDRDRGWLMDQNGKVRELAGTELEAEVTATYSSSFSHLLAGRMPGRVEYLREEEAYDVLRLLPEGGRPLTCYLDQEGGLPVKEEQPEADRVRTTYLGDWREVDGIRVPFHLRQTTGDPRYDTILTVEEVRFNPPLEEDAFQKPSEAALDYRFLAGRSTLNIPFELTSNHIYLQLRVNDSAPLWFLLDTGAAASVIDTGTAEALGLELKGQLEGRGAGEGSTDVAFVTGASFSLPGVELHDQTIAAISIAPLVPFEGRAIHGILGYDFASRFVLEIDYAAGLLHLYDPQAHSYAGPGEDLPITLEDNVPYIQAGVLLPGREAVEGKFLVDTGARVALVLNRPFVETHQLEPRKRITAPLGVGVGGETKQHIGRVAELRLGEVVVRDVVAGFSQDVRGGGADPECAGLIGGEVLRRFKAIFDYSDGRMILERNAHFEEPYEYDMSGLFLAAEGEAFDHFRVHRVVEGSPAAEAGLQEGDVIVALDGRTAAAFTLEQVRKRFAEAGRCILLEVRRDGEALQVELELRRLI